MPSLANLTSALRARCDLAAGEIAAAAAALADSGGNDQEKEEFLVALADKGETAAEVAGFARAFRDRAVDPGVGSWAARAVDVVGTGGDHAGGFNVSTLVVFVLASLGVPVMKHGNRGITSKCGSADLMADLGVDLAASVAKQRGAIEQLGFVYFFAPAYHPAFRNVAPVRKSLAARGRRSIFNILGPLINPGRPAHTLLGVYAGPWVPRMAEALDALGTSAGIAVHGRIDSKRGIDELTTATVNSVRGAGRLRDLDGEWLAADFGLPPAPFAELTGGDLETNRRLTGDLLSGRGPAGLVDTIVLNSATALWIAGGTPDVRSGLDPAREALLGGAVRRKIAATREYFQSS
jgi:anthranilate phosphoribosyltransferase